MKPLRIKKDGIFNAITSVDIPRLVKTNTKSGRSESFVIKFKSNGDIPFPQIIIRSHDGEHIFKEDSIKKSDDSFSVSIPENELPPGNHQIQIEGCRKKDWLNSGGNDWIKWFGEISVEVLPKKSEEKKTEPIINSKVISGVKLYFGIHKHMHQPFYRASDTSYRDGEIEAIFGSRCGNYTSFIPDAIKQYIDGGLSNAGFSTSWSGSLIEQLQTFEKENLCGGCFRNWNHPLRNMASKKTSSGNKRLSFTAFGYFHPLMPLIPQRDIVKQIDLHREIIKAAFNTNASDIIFPPETAFHIRMIPALKKAGIRAVIYDSIHRYRSCKDYPYAGINEGMLPPNLSDQVNPAVNDWIQLHNVWAGSKISPSLLKPEYTVYEDVDGTEYKIIAIPAERYIGNEDARGGYGALQYEHVLSQVYDNILKYKSFNPKHPPFFLLHSDGDNHGGGADSYYHHNTGRLVEWIKGDPRFELITIDDYLEQFPPDPSHSVHIEPGSWAGADNGDPQFRKWFSMYEQSYSPDLNSWAVLTALQNCIHTLEDSGFNGVNFQNAQRLLLTAETSCYWYWTGQENWDRQVTDAANIAFNLIKNDIELINNVKDKTPPTIFAPWITPENPGGMTWGQGCLKPAERKGTVHTFIYDITGIKTVDLVLHSQAGNKRLQMRLNGKYPSKTNPSIIADYYTVELPESSGDVKYYIEAVDRAGNRGYSSKERIFLA